MELLENRVLLSSYALTTLASSNGTFPPHGLGRGVDGLVQDSSGNLFGTSWSDDQNTGTVFEISTVGSPTTLAVFDGTNVSRPSGDLVCDASGNLYGTSAAGGANGWGSVYELPFQSGQIKTLWSFDVNTNGGTYPAAGLVMDGVGNLFGTTAAGGNDLDNGAFNSGDGTVFELVKAGDSYTFSHLASFDRNLNGSRPFGNMVLVNNTLYGTTYFYTGTVFKLDLSNWDPSNPQSTSPQITTIHRFDSTDAYGPIGALVQDSGGNVYGTTAYGGNANAINADPNGTGFGKVFKIASNGSFSLPLTFTGGSDGANPWGALVADTSGNLYGTASSGGQYGQGDVFEIPSGGTITPLWAFTGGDGNGVGPVGRLLRDPNGSLVGTTRGDGDANNYGTVFRLSPVTQPVTFSDTTTVAQLTSTIQDVANQLQQANSALGSGGEVSFQVSVADATQLSTVLSALSSSSTFRVNTSLPRVQVNIAVASGVYRDQMVSPGVHVDVVLDGTGQSPAPIFQGGSPALTLSSGNLTVRNVVLTNSTDAPTILVTGGALTLRNDVVQESDQYTQTAIEVDGGTADMGTAAQPGHNTIHVCGTGGFVHNTTATPVSAVGDTFLANGAPIDQNLQGLVWVDFNNDGNVDFGEQGIDGVSIALKGTDDLGSAVSLSTATSNGGIYSFNVRPGTYTLSEGSTSSAYIEGKNSLSTLGGNAGVPDVFSNVSVGVSQNGLNYNFGEQPAPGTAVSKGQAAGTGFWHNKNGQALIASFGGTNTSTDPAFNGLPKLSSWLAETMPNTYGVNAGTHNLRGKTSQQVAALFLQLFGGGNTQQNGQNDELDAQLMATALNVYATNASLGGSQAVSYGFKVSAYGLGDSTWNIGSDGAAFGVLNKSTLTIIQILQDWDQQANKGNTSLRKLALDTFNGINSKGGL
jgi:uncharacterized repeat protein (TIGR03803 family)